MTEDATSIHEDLPSHARKELKARLETVER
jgi:hypothetical protein